MHVDWPLVGYERPPSIGLDKIRLKTTRNLHTAP